MGADDGISNFIFCLKRSAPRTSEGVGDEGGLIWGSRLVGGNQIVKNKDLTPNRG
jgi:hypothetical protein